MIKMDSDYSTHLSLNLVSFASYSIYNDEVDMEHAALTKKVNNITNFDNSHMNHNDVTYDMLSLKETCSTPVGNFIYMRLI